ncbi:MAG: autotransporter-associated beta strand repeat-containing protein [Gemmatales bacterium]
MSLIRRKLLFGCALGILPLGQAWSQDTTWTGATNSNWDLVSNNWSGSWTNGRTAIFAGANQNPITVSSVSAFGISFTTVAYTLNSGTITLVSGGSSASGLVAGEIRVATGLTANINSVLAGSVGLRKNGDGTLVLSGNNTYTGGTTIAGGTLQVGNGSTTGSLGSGTATINSGTSLRYFRNDQHTLTTSFTGTGTLNFIGTGISNQSSYVLTGINNSSFAGALQVGSPGGNGARVVVNNSNQLGTASVAINNGSQIYMQSETYSNNFTINGIGWLEGANSLGALRMENGSTIIGSVTLAGNSRIGTSSSASVSGVISGGFSLEKTQTGTLTLSGNNTYTGGTSISAGTLSVSSNSNLGGIGGGLTFNGGTLQVTGTTFTSTPRTITWGTSGGGFDIASAANTFTVSQDLTSGGSLTKLGTGTLVLSGANTYTGGTFLNAGTLSVGSDGNLGTGTGGLTFNGGSLRATGTFTTNRATTLNGNGSFEVTGSNTLTHSAVISGAGGLTKAGTGTLVLSGANTYTGGTTLAGAAGSTVVLGNASALGASTNSLTINAGNTLNLNGQFAGGGVNVGTLTGTGTITNNPAGLIGGVLNVGNGNVSSTFAGTLQDGGGSKPLALNKVGSGTLTLTGNNTHSDTIISGGILSVANSSNLGAVGSIKFDGGGGTLQITGSSPFTYDGQVFFYAPGTVEIVDPSNTITFIGPLQNSNSLTKAGAGTLVLTFSSNTYSGGTILNGGTLSVSSNSNLGGGGLTFNGGTLQVTGTTFNNNSRSITWGTSGGGFDITSAANTFTVSQNLTSGGSLTKLGTGTLVLSGANTYTGGTNINAGILSVGGDGNLGTGTGGLTFNGGTLQATGSFTTNRATTLNANGTFEVTGSNTLTHSAVISGAGGLTKAGTGTLILSGANTYTGGTKLAGSAGSIVRLGNANALGNSNNSLTINAGNTLDLNGTTIAVGALSGLGNVTNTSGTIASLFTVGNGNADSTFSGIMQNGAQPLALQKVGTGTLILSGSSTYTGGTTINAGAVRISDDANLGSGGGGLTFNGGTLQSTVTFGTARPTLLNAPGGTFEVIGTTLTHAGNITGAGSLTKTGTGTLVLSGNNTYSGGTFLNNGFVQVNSDSRLGNTSGALTFNGGFLAATSSFSMNRDVAINAGGGTMDVSLSSSILTLNGNLSGTGTLTKSGSGSLILNGNTTAHTGNVTITGGSLRYLDNAGLPANVTNNGALLISRSATSPAFTHTGVISGTGALTKAGSAALILQGSNTYTGSTTVSAGALIINGNQSAANGDYTVNAGATIGGSGIVGKLINLNGGVISPGNPGSTGILTINGGLNFNANSSFRVELQGSVAGSGYDQLFLNSTTQSYVMVPGTQLIGDRLGNYQANFLDSFMIVKASRGGIGTFAGLPDGAFFNFDGQGFQIRYNVPDSFIVDPTGAITGLAGITWTGDDGFSNYGTDNGGNIVIAAVPEPSTWALILGTLSICGYVAYRRRHRTDAEDIVIE